MALPSTPMLDDFSRPDESPLSGQGRWALSDPDVGTLRITNRQVERAAPGAVFNEAYYTWTPGPVLTDCEAYLEVKVTGATSFFLGLRFSNPGGASTLSGYLLRCTTINMTICDLQGANDLALVSASFAPAVGDVIVFRAVGQTLTGYVVRGGAVQQVVSHTETFNNITSGRLGVGLNGDTVEAANFGGGSLLVPQVPSVRGTARLAAS